MLGSLIREFDQEKYDNTIRMDAYDEGHEAGVKEGHEAGVTQGQQSLLAKLVKDGAITMENAVLNGYMPEAK